jgi:hypothetical protein
MLFRVDEPVEHGVLEARVVDLETVVDDLGLYRVERAIKLRTKKLVNRIIDLLQRVLIRFTIEHRQLLRLTDTDSDQVRYLFELGHRYN